MSEEIVENPLGYEKTSTLLRKFAVPGIIAMVVNSIYNIVDQIFIGWGVGYLGNAATNVAFPVTVIAVAVFLSLGVGGATRYSIYLGEKRTEDAAKVVGIAVTAAVAFGIIYAAFVFIAIYKHYKHRSSLHSNNECNQPYSHGRRVSKVFHAHNGYWSHNQYNP